MIADHLGLGIASGKGNQQRCDQTNESSCTQIKFRLNRMKSSERIKSANRGDNERASHDRGQLVVSELRKRPRIQEIGAQAGDAQRTVRFDLVTDGMLHERIRDKDEVAGEPTPERYRHCRSKVSARSEPFLTPDQRTDKRALEEEREHSFHRQRLSDYPAGVFGKVRPIRSELKFHRNASDNADGKIESENLRPEPNGLVVFFVPSSKGAPFPVNQEQRQPHCELREQVVINDREPELQPVPKARIVEDRVHGRSLGRGACRLCLCRAVIGLRA